MYSENKKRAKIGKVNIDINGNRYRIRFTFPKGQRNEFKIIGEIDEDSWILALKTASLINRDIALDDVDFTFARYSAYKAKSLKIAETEPNLLELWNRYKELNQSRIALTTQEFLWKDCDRYLERIGKDRPQLLELSKAQELLAYLQTVYAVSTLATLFRSCLNPAINTSVKAGLIKANPFKELKIPKPPKKVPQCFTESEVKEIIAAFYSDEFNPPTSGYKHSHYAAFVETLARTFARPEEIIPLQYQDIRTKGGNTYLVFNKRYSKGILMESTKTNETRLFKCNQELIELLGKINSEQRKPTDLLFPAKRGGYINYSKWRDKNWKVVLKGLESQGRIEKYLSPYHLRHTGISLLIRSGVDIKKVATLSGHSVRTLISHYLASRDEIDLPPMY